jgi:hypothetical protein
MHRENVAFTIASATLGLFAGFDALKQAAPFRNRMSS